MKATNVDIERLKTLQAKPLSTYHQGVVNDFLRACTKWGKLTPKQEVFLTNIEGEYSQEAIEEHKQALHRLMTDEQYRADVRAVCDYYKSTGYYRSVVDSVIVFLGLGDIKNPPNLKSLDKMMTNKYATNILESINSTPKFEVGELVQLRANPSWDNIRSSGVTNKRKLLGAEAFLIIEVDSSPVSRPLTYCTTKGGTRWYKLLAMGSTDTFEVTERELKRPTKKTLGKK